MEIVIIGSGNVATVLGRLCKQKGHHIVQVVSRNATHAAQLAGELQCGSADYEGSMNTDADLYLVAVADTALFELGKTFSLENKLVLHTAGAVSKEVLQTLSSNYGVLYPLQSLRREMAYTQDIPLLVDANTAEARTLVEDFAKTLSGQVSTAGDAQRLRLHVAAVVVSNFTNHLYALAEDFCKKEGMDFNLLAPLVLETARRVERASPAAMQTGPAVRNDTFTIEKHLRVLSAHPQLKYLYIKLTDSIMKGIV